MARNTSDREDLLRDGSQMPIRGRLIVEGQELFLGFRSAGQASLYYNQDPVFQFNANNELRRVFFRGERYAAYDGQLRCLKQVEAESADNVVSQLRLIQVPASDESIKAIVDEFRRIRDFLQGQNVDWEFVGVESVEDFIFQVNNWLENVGNMPAIATSPSA